MHDDKTNERKYPLPNRQNPLCVDVGRLREALTNIDKDMLGALKDGIEAVQKHTQDTPHLTIVDVETKSNEAVTTHETEKPHLSTGDVDGRIDTKIAAIPTPAPELVPWERVQNVTGLPEGTPVKKVDGDTSYHILGLGAAPSGGTLYKGDVTRVIKIDTNLPGRFADAASATAIKDKTGDPLYWDFGPGVLVGAKHLIQTADSAATGTQPAINVMVEGAVALSADVVTATTRQSEGCHGVVTHGDAVEIKVTQATGGTPGHDAEGLSVSLLFVLV